MCLPCFVFVFVLFSINDMAPPSRKEAGFQRWSVTAVGLYLGWGPLQGDIIYSLIKYLLWDLCSVQSLSRIRLFATPWTAAHQASLSITNSQSPPKPTYYVGDAIQPSHPVSSPSPALNLSQHRSFQMSQLFASGGQSIGSFSFSCIIPMNIQD